MIKKSTDLQRKSPKQNRSKELVEAIFEATVRILPQVGSQQITTRKIAELAGVSIGSLYQYFPNKESVLSALMDMGMKLKTSQIQKKIDEIHGKSLEESVNTLVDFAVDTFLIEKEKNREIYRQAPELGRIPSLLKLRQSVVERIAQEMQKHRPGLLRQEYIRISFVAVNSIMGVIHTMLYDESQTYSRAELAIELKIMLKSYFESHVSSFIK